MKYLSLFFAFVIINTSLYSQEETLIGNGIEHGGFGGPVLKFTQIKGELGIMVGGYGGWLINHQFMIGGGGFGLVNEIRASTEAEKEYSSGNKPLFVEFGYGGGMFEYILTPNKLVHFSINLLIGAGGVNYRYNYRNENNDWYYTHRGSDAVFVLEPTMSVELNLISWCRTSIGAGYRYVSGINDLVGISNKDLSGISGNITFKFGTF